MPGKLVNHIQLSGSAATLRENLDKHDLGTGVASDCACVVVDYRLYPCSPQHDPMNQRFDPKAKGKNTR